MSSVRITKTHIIPIKQLHESVSSNKLLFRGSLKDYEDLRSIYSSEGMCQVVLALHPLAFSLDLAIANYSFLKSLIAHGRN